MNRRSFNTALAGSAALIAAPVPAFKAATAAAPSRGPLLAWASAIARAQNKSSPALLAQQLKIPMETAQGLYASLLQDGVIRMPAAGTVAKAVKPASFGASSAPRLPDAKAAAQRLKAWAESRPQDLQPQADDTAEADAPQHMEGVRAAPEPAQSPDRHRYTS